MDPERPQETLSVSGGEQERLLAHPLRHRLWMAISSRPATISQLSRILEVNKGNVSHHLKILVKAGLARSDQTRTVRGGTEHYYRAAEARLRVEPEARQEITHTILDNLTADVLRAKDPWVSVRHVRLSEHQAHALMEHLQQVIQRLPAAGPRESVYGVMVSVYARGTAPPTS